jgi:hypothetical protein
LAAPGRLCSPSKSSVAWNWTLRQKLDWYIESGDLPAGLKAEDAADLSFLEHVLDELGRQ